MSLNFFFFGVRVDQLKIPVFFKNKYKKKYIFLKNQYKLDLKLANYYIEMLSLAKYDNSTENN